MKIVGVVVLLTASVLVVGCAGGGSPTPTPLPTIAGNTPKPGVAIMADRYYDALNRGAVSDMVGLLDQDVVLTVGGSQIVGKADVIARLITSFSALADYAYSNERLEGNSFFATHTYVVDAERETGIFPLANTQIELVAQDGKITFINVSSDAEPPASVEATTVPSGETPTPTAVPAEEQQDLEAIRRLAFEYWIAFNEHDTDKVLSYLEESYAAQRQGDISDQIGRIKLFRVSLGVSQRSSPVLLSPTEGEMMLNLKEPLGTRTIRMGFRKVDGDWKITYAEDIE